MSATMKSPQRVYAELRNVADKAARVYETRDDLGYPVRACGACFGRVNRGFALNRQYPIWRQLKAGEPCDYCEATS